MKPEFVSVVIVNYNGSAFLPACLDSLVDQSYSQFEIILVDNGSTDDSISKINVDYPGVRLIRNSTNLGFAKACNQGIELSEGEYVAFLNYDTVVDRDWLNELVKGISKSTDIGAVMSKILIIDKKPPTINSSGGIIHFLGISWSGNFNLPDSSIQNEERQVAFVSGAAMLARRAVLDEVLPFDEDFFMYCEDTDLSWRMRLAGYRLMYEPASIVHHHYHFSKNKMKFYYLERNRLSMVLTNYDKRTLFLIALPAFLFEIGMMANALVGGWLRLKLKTYFDLLLTNKAIREKRRRVQALRKVTDREITSIFTSEIDFFAVNNIVISFLNFFYKLYWKLIYRLIR